MGRSRQTVGYGFMANLDCRVAPWRLVGLYDFGMGRVLGMGSCRKLSAYAMACDDSVRTFDYGAEEERYVPNVEYGSNHHQFHIGTIGNVY